MLFFTLVSSIKKDLRREVVCNLFTRGKKERERKMKTTREKVKEGKIRFQKQKVLALFSHAKKTSRKQVFGFLSFKSSFVQRNLSRKTPHNTLVVV